MIRSVALVRSFYQEIDTRISIHVVTTEDKTEQFVGAFGPDIVLHGVPRTFQPTKALYKARKLEWFRLFLALGPRDWVMHLDEETMIDKLALKTSLDFVQRQGYAHIGQVGSD